MESNENLEEKSGCGCGPLGCGLMLVLASFVIRTGCRYIHENQGPKIPPQYRRYMESHDKLGEDVERWVERYGSDGKYL